MKQKLIILEGQNVHTDENSNYYDTPGRLFNAAQKSGIDVEIIEGIYHKKQDFLIEKFNEGTDFFFQSTFHYESNIAGLAKFFGKIEESKNFYIAGYNDDLIGAKVLGVLNHDAQLASSIKHHNFYLVSTKFDIPENVTDIKSIFRECESLETIARKAAAVEAEIAKMQEIRNEKHRKAKLNPTGRKIRILDVKGFAPAFEGLTNGDVVDELDPVIIDYPGDRPRGVWIWGNGEPVKLLNDDVYSEFEFVSGMTKNGVLEELYKWEGSKIPNPTFQFKKEVMLNDEEQEEEFDVPLYNKPNEFRFEEALKILEDRKTSTWDRATELLDLFNLPRRTLRVKLEKLIQLNEKTYFKPVALTRNGRKTISLGF